MAWGRESYHTRRQNRSERPSEGVEEQSDRQRRPAPFGPPVKRASRCLRLHAAQPSAAPGTDCRAALSPPVCTWLLSLWPFAARPLRASARGRSWLLGPLLAAVRRAGTAASALRAAHGARPARPRCGVATPCSIVPSVRPCASSWRRARAALLRPRCRCPWPQSRRRGVASSSAAARPFSPQRRARRSCPPFPRRALAGALCGRFNWGDKGFAQGPRARWARVVAAAPRLASPLAPWASPASPARPPALAGVPCAPAAPVARAGWWRRCAPCPLAATRHGQQGA